MVDFYKLNETLAAERALHRGQLAQLSAENERLRGLLEEVKSMKYLMPLERYIRIVAALESDGDQ